MGNNTEKRDVVITLRSGQALSSIAEMQTTLRKLRSEFRKTTDEGKRKEVAAEMKRVNSELSKQWSLTRGAQGGWQKLNGTIMKLGAGLAAMVSVQALMNGLNRVRDALYDYSDALADVQKRTELNVKEATELDKKLLKINTRTPRKELLGLAEVAGRLGIRGVKDIADFVEEADKIQVALGEDLGDDALLQIAKISKAFRTEMKNIGSAINTVGNETRAQEGYLVDFLNRTQGIGETADISAADLIGYGAVLDSFGQKVEMSGTAMNTFFIDFVKNVGQFEKVAGFANGELSKLIGEKGTNAGFIAFLEKLKETNPEADKFLGKLEEVGVTGTRGAQVFQVLANNLDMVKSSQQLANDSFDEGTSILDEFNTKNENFAANWDKLVKFFGSKLTDNPVARGLREAVSWAVQWTETPLSQTIQDEQVELNVLVGRILELNEGNEERGKLIKQLQKDYPDFLGNIRAESADNATLAKRLEEVNEQLINRIIIQRKQEELDEQNEKVASAKIKQMETEAELRKRLHEVALEYGMDISNATSLEEKYAAVQKTLAEGFGNYGMAVDKNKRRNHELYELQLTLSGATSAYNRAVEEGNSILSEREELMRQLGISAEKAGETTAPETSGGGGVVSGEPSEDEKKAAKKWADETKKLIQEWQDAKVNAITDVETRELQALELKYEREVERIEAETAGEAEKNQLIKQLTINHENEKTAIMAEAHQARLDAEAERVKQANDSDLLTLQLKIDTSTEGSEDEVKAVIAMLTKRMQLELESLNLTNEQKLLLVKKYQDEATRLWDDYHKGLQESTEGFIAWEDLTYEQKLERVRDYMQQIGDVVQEVFDTIGSMYDVQLQNIAASEKAEIESLDKQAEKGMINQEQYNKKKAEIEKRYAEKERAIKRKQFEVERTASIVKATMAMAQAINVAMSGGPVIGQVLAGITAALAAVQIGVISSQPNPYYMGGYTDVTDTGGARHHAKKVGSFADGGWYSNASYGVVGERGPELVVPNWVVNSPDYADSIAQIEGAIYKRNVSVSGGTAQGNAKTTSTSTGGQTTASGTDPAVAQLLERNNQFLEQLIVNGVRGDWEWNRFREGVQRMENIENKHYFSSGTARKPGERV